MTMAEHWDTQAGSLPAAKDAAFLRVYAVDVSVEKRAARIAALEEAP